METTPVIESFLVLGLIIGAAQLAGSLARSLGQPRVFGELLAGVLLGPTLLNLLHWSAFDNQEFLELTIHEFAELGVLFLMFTIGLEVHLSELLSVGRVAVYGGTFGALVPVALALPVMLIFGYEFDTGLFTGIVLAATSVSISAQTLLELGVLRTKEGSGLLATAVVDDVLAILLLSIAVATMGSDTQTSALDLVWILARMALYLAGALATAWFVLPRLFNRLHHMPQLTANIASFALIAALVFGWAADALGGVAAITGAFIAGLGLGQTTERVRLEIENTVRRLSYSFLVPIFFVSVGLNTDLTQIGADLLPLAAVLAVVAVISKVGGSGAGARLGGFTQSEALRLGVCMISRGEVGLIIASVGLTNGLLEGDLFEPLFLVILLSTVMTPPLVRWAFRYQSPRSPAQVQHG